MPRSKTSKTTSNEPHSGHAQLSVVHRGQPEEVAADDPIRCYLKNCVSRIATIGGKNSEIGLYVREIERAATTVLNTLWAEVKRFELLDAEIKKLEMVVNHNYQQAQAWQESEDPEDVAMGAGIYWQTYFDEDKERHHKSQDKGQLEQQITVHRFSMDSMAGSLLQFGKQGTSLAYDSPGKTPKPGK